MPAGPGAEQHADRLSARAAARPPHHPPRQLLRAARRGQAGYRLQIAAAARTEAGKLLAWAARADADQLKPDEQNHFSVYVDQPEDRTTYYDRAIAMLQAGDAQCVELNETDDARYVRGEWDWRPAWDRSYHMLARRTAAMERPVDDPPAA